MPQRFSEPAICAAVGLGIGFAGGLVAIFIAGIMFLIMSRLQSLSRRNRLEDGEIPTGLGFLVLMMGRGAAWAVAAVPAGIGQGIALREWKVVLNGLLGGVLGGLIGGMAFDPISKVFMSADGRGLAQPRRRLHRDRPDGRAVRRHRRAMDQVGVAADEGRSIGGKTIRDLSQPDRAGSAPKADVYLFKDEAIEPRHAMIHDRGGRFEIEDMDTGDGTYVNGIPYQEADPQVGRSDRARQDRARIYPQGIAPMNRGRALRLVEFLHTRLKWLVGLFPEVSCRSRFSVLNGKKLKSPEMPRASLRAVRAAAGR